MLSIAYVVEMGALICLPIVDQRLGDIVDWSLRAMMSPLRVIGRRSVSME